MGQQKQEVAGEDATMNEAALEDTVDRLHRYGQAATYGAVAGVVGGHPRTVMQGRDRSLPYSWVVNKRTRVPTGYEPHEIDSRLSKSITERGVIETPEVLNDWLAGHPRLRDQEHEKGKTVPTLDDLIDHEFVEYCAREIR